MKAKASVEQAVVDLTSAIVDQAFPIERDFFNDEASNLLEQLTSRTVPEVLDRGEAGARSDITPAEAVALAIPAFKFVSVAWGTVRAIDGAIKWWRSKTAPSNRSALIAVWTEHLMAEGLSPQDAERIAETFAEHVSKLIEEMLKSAR
jgi:hypothetical protein